jgi:putative sterol carrier protein
MREEQQVSEAQDVTTATDFSSLDPAQVAGAISSVTDEQLREALSGPQREAIIGEVFRRMEQHFKPGGAAVVDAVVHWKVTGPADGAFDHYEVVLRNGTCTAGKDPQHEPRVTLALDGVDFMRLVTGNAAGPTLFMSGKLKIEGDLMFSAQIQSMFTIPS